MAPKKDAQLQRKSEKYINVYFYGFGRWGAWAREPKVGGERLFLGCHLTERLAARCQDRALLRMEMEPWAAKEIKLNFERGDYEEDADLRSNLTIPQFLNCLSRESRAKYKRSAPTACLIKFAAQEAALGNLAPAAALAICAPRTRSQDSGKGPNSTSTNQKKRRKSDANSDDCLSQPGSDDEGEGEGAGAHLAIGPFLSAPEPLAWVAPVALRKPRTASAGERQVAPWIQKEALPWVAPAPLPTNRTGNGQTSAGRVALRASKRQRTRTSMAVSEDEREAAEALLMLSRGACTS